MPILRIKEPGFENYTGDLGDIWFEDGVSSEVVSNREAERLACIMALEIEGSGENPSATERMVQERRFTIEEMENASKQRYEKQAKIQDIKDKSEQRVEKEIQNLDSEKKSTTVVEYSFTYESLAEIADKEGLKGLRDFAEPYGVRGKSVKDIINSLLAMKEANK